MKFPETADDVKNEILISSDKATNLGDLRIRQLIKILKNVDPEIIVEGIIRVIENGNSPMTNFQAQEFSGKILEEVNPKSEKELKGVLLRILRNWDPSVEQFPIWLRENYGIDKLNETFPVLELTQDECNKLQTVKWWLNLKESKV